MSIWKQKERKTFNNGTRNSEGLWRIEVFLRENQERKQAQTANIVVIKLVRRQMQLEAQILKDSQKKQLRYPETWRMAEEEWENDNGPNVLFN